MHSAKTAAIATLPTSKQEMDDRKRALVNDVEDLAPSRKRVKDENGAGMRMSDESKEKDVEVGRYHNPSVPTHRHDRCADIMQDFQKDAILRQMKEYKRQKKDAEDQYSELQKKTRWHDDHLRTIDAWFAQLLDEVRVIAAEMLPTPPPSASSTTGMPIRDTTYEEGLKLKMSQAKRYINLRFYSRII
jgi:E3 ubiquitin-protein ligase BRE1